MFDLIPRYSHKTGLFSRKRPWFSEPRRANLRYRHRHSLDADRTIGQPNKITVILGRKATKQYCGKPQTESEDMDLSNPVIRSHYRNGFNYARDHLILHTEAADEADFCW
jgi:hypothetical protein